MSINTGDKEIGKLVENKIKMLLQQSSAILLQKWWRRRTNTKELRIIHNYLSNSLNP